MKDIQNDLLPELGLQADEHVKNQLTETAKWSKFISIVMFVCAVFVLMIGALGGALFTGTLDRMGGQFGELIRVGGAMFLFMMIVIALFIAGIYYFLFAFSIKVKRAIVSENTQEFTSSVKMLKVYFIATTIFAILALLNDIKNLF